MDPYLAALGLIMIIVPLFLKGKKSKKMLITEIVEKIHKKQKVGSVE